MVGLPHQVGGRSQPTRFSHPSLRCPGHPAASWLYQQSLAARMPGLQVDDDGGNLLRLCDLSVLVRSRTYG